MTVIAWDGKTLAADKQSLRGVSISTCTKIFQLEDGSVVCICGRRVSGLILMDWHKAGADPKDYPKLDNGDNSILIVAKVGQCHEYQGAPKLVPVEQSFEAWGDGREYAIGAMAKGATAVEAVEIASYHCEGCGRGVDSFPVGKE